VNFDTTRNLFIEGDNLDALKLLQETYLGKVKLIYIDPPYNTGNDFIYEDDFAETTDEYLLKSTQKDEEGNRLVANTESNGRFHSDWLSMMYSRLKVAKSILSESGVIFISIDDGEMANLKKICDEIFGNNNFIANIVWEKKYSPQNDAKWFSDNHDHILLYANEKELWRPVLLPRTEEQNSRYTNRDNDPRGPWKSSDFSVRTYSQDYDYPITLPSGRIINPPKSRCWRTSEKNYEKLVKDNRIWFGEDGNNVPSIKRFLSEVRDGLVPLTIWKYSEVGHNQDAAKEIRELFSGEGLFDTPKPIKLLKRVIDISLKFDGIVIDFFAGSATTAHAIMELNAEDGGNRQFIMVQLPEPCDEKSDAFNAGYSTIADISKERIRRAGKKILEDNRDKEGIDRLDTGFRVLKVDSSTMAEVYYKPNETDQATLGFLTDNIKPDRSPEDLLFHVLLDWGVDLTLPIRKETLTVHSTQYDVFFVDDNALAACFAKAGEVTDDFCRELAARHPLRVVFRDAGFKNDAAKINADQIFKLLSPQTEVRCI